MCLFSGIVFQLYPSSGGRTKSSHLLRLDFVRLPDIPLILDVFDEHASDEQAALSKDDQKFLEIVQDNIAVHNEGFISMPLPFKQDKITFPDNRKAVLNRTQNSLNRIKIDILTPIMSS